MHSDVYVLCCYFAEELGFYNILIVDNEALPFWKGLFYVPIL